jgi:hypothetical protein
MPSLSDVLRRYWPVLAATAVLVPHALLFDFVSDDAYISFRYAHNLAEHGQLVFNPGERVEGFTNFLWTVLLAGGIEAGASPVVASRFLGVIFAVANLALLVRMSLWLDRDRPSGWHGVAPLGLAATGTFACWVSGGLETQMFTFFAMVAFYRLLVEVEERRGFGSGFLFAVAALTRPEGVLLFALAGVYRLGANWARERRIVPRRHEIVWVAAFAGVFGPYFGWRWGYYGWPFPNTFYVKSSGGAAGTIQNGVYYLRRFAEDYGVFFLAPLAALGWPARLDRRRRSLFALTAVVWAGFAFYVVRVGGDFMGLYRFILPVLPLGALVLQEGLRTLAGRLVPFAGRPALALASLMIVAGFVVVSIKVDRTAVTVEGAENGIDTPAYLKRYALDRIPIGIWFGLYGRPDDLMTVGGAGVIPYYSGIAAYDVFGLVDDHIAHDRRMTVGDRAGHQKWATEEYMLSRHPTLITHYYCLGGPCAYERNPWPGYEWVHITTAGIQPMYYSFMKRRDRAFGPFPAHK